MSRRRETAAGLPEPVLDLLLAGARSSWLPPGYGVEATVSAGGICRMGVGTTDELVSVELVPVGRALAALRPIPQAVAPDCLVPSTADLAAAHWLSLCAAAWSHFHASHTQPSPGDTP